MAAGDRFGRLPGIRLTGNPTAGVFAKAVPRSEIPICIGLAEVASISYGCIQSLTADDWNAMG